MRVTFWGTRGSLPTPLDGAGVRRKLIDALVRANGRDLPDAAAAAAFVDGELSFAERGTFGGDTTCVEIATGGDDFLLCDLGSGARRFGLSAMGRTRGQPRTYNVLMSHVHWDHVMGFPFFVPAYVPGNRIVVHGCHAEMEAAFRRQQSAPSFPVEFDQMRATIEFVTLEPDRTVEIGGFRVTPKRQRHGNVSYGYRIEKDGKVFVFSTDAEHKVDDQAEMQAFVEFFRDADAVVFDAQYSLDEAVTLKQDWGHSSNVVGVELCSRAGAKHLLMVHHDPTHDDARIALTEAEARRYEEIMREDQPLRVTAAHDGLVVDL